MKKVNPYKSILLYPVIERFRDIRLTSMLEIPYRIEGVDPGWAIDSWGIAGKAPKGLMTGAGCPTTVLWVEDLRYM